MRRFDKSTEIGLLTSTRIELEVITPTISWILERPMVLIICRWYNQWSIKYFQYSHNLIGMVIINFMISFRGTHSIQNFLWIGVPDSANEIVLDRGCPVSDYSIQNYVLKNDFVDNERIFKRSQTHQAIWFSN